MGPRTLGTNTLPSGALPAAMGARSRSVEVNMVFVFVGLCSTHEDWPIPAVEELADVEYAGGAGSRAVVALLLIAVTIATTVACAAASIAMLRRATR